LLDVGAAVIWRCVTSCLSSVSSVNSIIMRLSASYQVDKLAYNKYLQEVMSVLMSDQEFANKIQDVGKDFPKKVMSLSV